MNYLLIISSIFLSLLGYLFLYIFNRDKIRSNIFLTIMILFAAILTVTIQFSREALNKRSHEEINQRYKSLRSENRYLINQNDSLRIQVRELTSQLEPVIRIAKENFPGLGGTRLLGRLGHSRTVHRAGDVLAALTDEHSQARHG